MKMHNTGVLRNALWPYFGVSRGHDSGVRLRSGFTEVEPSFSEITEELGHGGVSLEWPQSHTHTNPANIQIKQWLVLGSAEALNGLSKQVYSRTTPTGTSLPRPHH